MKLRKALIGDQSALVDFGRKQFGKNSCVANKNFFKWFMESRTENETLIVEEGQPRISSMLNVIRLTSINGLKPVSVIFNYQSDPEVKGAGFLILRKIAKLDSFIVPGVTGPLAETYLALKAKKHTYFWAKKLLVSKNMLAALRLLFSPKVTIDKIKVEKSDMIVTNVLDEDVYRLFSNTLLKGHIEFLRWRLQSLDNNRSFVAINKVDNSVLLASVGKRRNIPVMRIYSLNGCQKSILNLLKELEGIARKIGILVILISAEMEFSSLLSEKAGFIALSKQPDTMIKGEISPDILEQLGLYSDLGFSEQWS